MSNFEIFAQRVCTNGFCLLGQGASSWNGVAENLNQEPNKIIPIFPRQFLTSYHFRKTGSGVFDQNTVYRSKLIILRFLLNACARNDFVCLVSGLRAGSRVADNLNQEPNEIIPILSRQFLTSCHFRKIGSGDS